MSLYHPIWFPEPRAGARRRLGQGLKIQIKTEVQGCLKGRCHEYSWKMLVAGRAVCTLIRVLPSTLQLGRATALLNVSNLGLD